LDDNFAEIENTLRRFTVALSAAVDPEMYRKEYLKKLYKLLDVSGEKDPLSYFAKYSAGELPRAALKSFVRQAQAERKVKSGKADAEEYDKLAAIHQELGLEPPQRAAQQPQGVDTRVNYELYDRTTNAVIDTFPARNDDEARVRLDDYRSWPGASNPDNFGVRRAGRPATTAPAPTAEQYYDVTWTDGGSESHMRVRAVTATGAMYMVRNHLQRQGIGAENIEAQVSRYQDAPGSTTDLQRQRAAAAQQPAPQPAGGESFTGEWKIVDDSTGQELYRFSGIGNNQRDANRVAANWLSQNAPDAEMQDVGVYPVMNESLREYKMPQPSQGPGRYRDLNEPLGPETPPTMPAGTVKVDVSDVYDWYKLGQHISNMKDLGQHDFGQGPPSAIMSFGDEDLEHQYIQALKRTGLTTTDIDPVDPDQPSGMPRQKTDPTYNVDENFADGKNPGRKGLAKRVGVNTKASVSDLRKTAKNSSGEKQRMAHWLANMKAGRAKAKKK
jgi:hypothetical protein